MECDCIVVVGVRNGEKLKEKKKFTSEKVQSNRQMMINMYSWGAIYDKPKRLYTFFFIQVFYSHKAKAAA